MTTLFLENLVLKKENWENRIQNDVMCSKFTLHNRTQPVRTYTVSSVVHTAYLQIVRAYINNNLWHSTVGVGETEEKWDSTGVIEREQNDIPLPRARSLPRSIAHVRTSRHITHYFAFFRCCFVLLLFFIRFAFISLVWRWIGNDDDDDDDIFFVSILSLNSVSILFCSPCHICCICLSRCDDESNDVLLHDFPGSRELQHRWTMACTPIEIAQQLINN